MMISIGVPLMLAGSLDILMLAMDPLLMVLLVSL